MVNGYKTVVNCNPPKIAGGLFIVKELLPPSFYNSFYISKRFASYRLLNRSRTVFLAPLGTFLIKKGLFRMYLRLSFLSVVFTLSFFLTHASLAQVAFNPQIGLSASMLSTDPQGSEATARFGYQIGATLRIGDQLYFQPGLFWQRSGTELRTTDELDLDILKDQVDLDAIFVPIALGYNLIDTQALVLRINGGVAGTLILNVQDNLLGLELENFNGILAGAPVGVGVDLFGLLTVDASYEFGLTNVFDEIFGLTVDATNNVFRLNVGLVF